MPAKPAKPASGETKSPTPAGDEDSLLNSLLEEVDDNFIQWDSEKIVFVKKVTFLGESKKVKAPQYAATLKVTEIDGQTGMLRFTGEEREVKFNAPSSLNTQLKKLLAEGRTAFKIKYAGTGVYNGRSFKSFIVK